ncbi:DGQHR domain-containing protein [Cronobacter dublinensis]|nr:hypothetical protein [Cronobacter dublinensis]ELQ6169871.1 DGQHR domain-containing protein [Cronobacter dublinensis]
MGDWVYYSCLISIAELGKRVDYAKDIHSSNELSTMIQRSLEGERAEHIANYLEKTQERFFNSLVLATYDGSPEWIEVGNFESNSHISFLENLDKEDLECFGFLSLSGNEKIFAVDGQHRLAGIKKALSDNIEFSSERLSIILVSHNEKKRERTRRLFTTLNKTAKPVKKKDIIALDEDDTMAIIARRFVEDNPWFKPPKILVDSRENIPATNRISLTTISNLYDVLKLIFRFINGEKTDTNLRFYRPSDADLDNYYIYAEKYFAALAKAFPAINEIFETDEPRVVTRKYRNDEGGHVLFRPVGLVIFTHIAINYANHHDVSLSDAVESLSKLPTDLSKSPYAGVIWDLDRKKMILTGKKLCIDLLSYIFNMYHDEEKLRNQYSKALGKEKECSLPGKIN